MVIYALAFAAPCLIAFAAILAVIRANKDDLPDIVRALMRMSPRDKRRDDDSSQPPPLPKP